MEPVKEIILTPTTALFAKIIFILLFVGAIAIFAKRAMFLFQALKIGVPDPKPRTDDPVKRLISKTIKRVLVNGISMVIFAKYLLLLFSILLTPI